MLKLQGEKILYTTFKRRRKPSLVCPLLHLDHLIHWNRRTGTELGKAVCASEGDASVDIRRRLMCMRNRDRTLKFTRQLSSNTLLFSIIYFFKFSLHPRSQPSFFLSSQSSPYKSLLHHPSPSPLRRGSRPWVSLHPETSTPSRT